MPITSATPCSAAKRCRPRTRKPAAHACAVRATSAAASKGARTGSVIEVLILQATAYHALGHTTAAVAALEDALRRAEAEGYIRLFLHAGPAVTALLASVASGEHATDHARRVLAAVDDTAASPRLASGDARPTTRNGLVEELSTRELDVLRLLVAGGSNREIADALFVSPRTVQAHLANLFGKLEVHTRAAAVARAYELGLV